MRPRSCERGGKVDNGMFKVAAIASMRPRLASAEGFLKQNGFDENAIRFNEAALM